MASQATLADSFLADFDSDDESEEEQQEQKQEVGKTKVKQEAASDEDVPDLESNEMNFDEEALAAAAIKYEVKESSAPAGSLFKDGRLELHMKKLAALMAQEANGDEDKVIDKEAEYEVIVQSNKLVQEIDDEISRLHKDVRDMYAVKYHELEEVVHTPIEYAKCVKIIGNEKDMSAAEKELEGIVPSSLILTISVTASTTVGKPLPPDELKKCFDACDLLLQLDESRKTIYDYIESRMTVIAPNLSVLVGSGIAARLIGIAGGLTALTKIPSCNLQVLGIKRKGLSGFSSATQDIHVGMLGQSELMITAPPDLRNRVLRLLAAKCTLAARMDSFNEDETGEKGRELLEEIRGKVTKWQEPPPAKLNKALPRPAEQAKKRRGGKRFRKKKEKFQVTELQKQKNKLLFGVEEQTDDYTGEGMGLIGQSGTGMLRVQKTDTQKLKSNISRSTKARMNRVKGHASVGGGTSGMETVFAMTPVQGVELKMEQKQQQKKQSNEYFGSSGSFFRVGSGAATPLPSSRDAYNSTNNLSKNTSNEPPAKKAKLNVPPVPRF